jgi:hypothetical protein
VPPGTTGDPPEIRQTRLLLLSTLTALGGLATGLYLPAFPEMAVDLAVLRAVVVQQEPGLVTRASDGRVLQALILGAVIEDLPDAP